MGNVARAFLQFAIYMLLMSILIGLEVVDPAPSHWVVVCVMYGWGYYGGLTHKERM